MAVPSDATALNCRELRHGGHVPERLWRSFEGEFVMTERWGDDDRPYLQSQGLNSFTIFAYGSIANMGVGSHVRNVLGAGGSSLNFDTWVPSLPGTISDPLGIFKVRTAYSTEVYFDGANPKAHPMTELPMLGDCYVSGIWQADGPRFATNLPEGGKVAFHYQLLHGSQARLRLSPAPHTTERERARKTAPFPTRPSPDVHVQHFNVGRKTRLRLPAGDVGPRRQQLEHRQWRARPPLGAIPRRRVSRLDRRRVVRRGAARLRVAGPESSGVQMEGKRERRSPATLDILAPCRAGAQGDPHE